MVKSQRMLPHLSAIIIVIAVATAAPVEWNIQNDPLIFISNPVEAGFPSHWIPESVFKVILNRANNPSKKEPLNKHVVLQSNVKQSEPTKPDTKQQKPPLLPIETKPETKQQKLPKLRPSETKQQKLPKLRPTKTKQQQLPKLRPSETKQQQLPKLRPSETKQQELPKRRPSETKQQKLPKRRPSETKQQKLPRRRPSETNSENEQQNLIPLKPATPSTESEATPANPAKSTESLDPEEYINPRNDEIHTGEDKIQSNFDTGDADGLSTAEPDYYVGVPVDQNGKPLNNVHGGGG